MTGPTAADTVRVTVAGPVELVVEVSGSDVATDPPDRVAVRSLDGTPAQRAAGEQRFEVVVDGWVFDVRVEPASRAALRERARRGAAAATIHSRQVVRAQLPGQVVRLWVEPGQTVEPGQRLLAIEAMKMENEVRATRGGTVEWVAVEVGEKVELGSELLVID